MELKEMRARTADPSQPWAPPPGTHHQAPPGVGARDQDREQFRLAPPGEGARDQHREQIHLHDGRGV